MIRLATAFSGIGAIEHGLNRMGIDNEIIFACDNGDVNILTKDVDTDIDEIEAELKKYAEEIANLDYRMLKLRNKIEKIVYKETN